MGDRTFKVNRAMAEDAPRTYKQQIVDLVKKLPVNIGVKFHSDEGYLGTQIASFRMLRADREYFQSIAFHDEMYPPERMVMDAFYALTKKMLYEENE